MTAAGWTRILRDLLPITPAPVEGLERGSAAHSLAGPLSRVLGAAKVDTARPRITALAPATPGEAPRGPGLSLVLEATTPADRAPAALRLDLEVRPGRPPHLMRALVAQERDGSDRLLNGDPHRMHLFVDMPEIIEAFALRARSLGLVDSAGATAMAREMAEIMPAFLETAARRFPGADRAAAPPPRSRRPP